MAATLVSHPGIVIGWVKTQLRIQIITGGACGNCSAKGACTLGGTQENRETEILAFPDEGVDYKSGDLVTVTMTTSQGFRAVWWAFLMPLILFLATVFFLGPILQNEILTALTGLGVLGISWGTLYFLKKLFEKQFVFKARRTP